MHSFLLFLLLLLLLVLLLSLDIVNTELHFSQVRRGQNNAPRLGQRIGQLLRRIVLSGCQGAGHAKEPRALELFAADRARCFEEERAIVGIIRPTDRLDRVDHVFAALNEKDVANAYHRIFEIEPPRLVIRNNPLNFGNGYEFALDNVAFELALGCLVRANVVPSATPLAHAGRSG